MRGCYAVCEFPLGDTNAADIHFVQQKDVTGQIPDEQANLKTEAERTLAVINGVFKPSDKKFRQYFNELLELSRYGLIGDHPQPMQAMETLRILQNRFLNTEKGRLITVHMIGIVKSLSLLIAVISAVGVLTAIGLKRVGIDVGQLIDLAPLFAVLPSMLIGLVLASFLRCRAVTFLDLHIIEADRFSPMMRGLFAITLLFVAGIFLKAGVFEIEIGRAQLSNFDIDLISALAFGSFVGLAQEPIISRIEAVREKV